MDEAKVAELERTCEAYRVRIKELVHAIARGSDGREPAFPCTSSATFGQDAQGMTYRQWLVGQALTRVLPSSVGVMAADAIALADAVLAGLAALENDR